MSDVKFWPESQTTSCVTFVRDSRAIETSERAPKSIFHALASLSDKPYFSKRECLMSTSSKNKAIFIIEPTKRICSLVSIVCVFLYELLSLIH